MEEGDDLVYTYIIQLPEINEKKQPAFQAYCGTLKSCPTVIHEILPKTTGRGTHLDWERGDLKEKILCKNKG